MQNNDKLLISKIIDKIKFSKNRITNSEFLNEYQISMVEKELKRIGFTNYFFEGGSENAESKILIAYPEALGENIARENVNNILKAIKIELPNEICGKLQHRDYLGTVMSFGLVRERIGDIIVHEDSAYIIVLEENANYLKTSFEYEKRFKKAKISIIDVHEIKTKPIEFEEIIISVNSVRLDSVISEIIKTSRRIAQEFLEEEKVTINYVVETKPTKTIIEKDIITIRGKGKFIVDEFLGKNKKDKEIIKIQKYR